MLTALGMYSESFEKPFLECTSEFYAKEGVKYMQQSDIPEYLKHVESRLQEENERCILYLEANTRKPLIATTEKQLLERHTSAIIEKLTAEGVENGLEFTIVRPLNWIGPRMGFIPGVDGPSEGVSRVLACFSNNLLRREPMKLVEVGQSQRTFVYSKDAIEAVVLMVENPARGNGHIFNVGNPDNEVTVRELAQMMTEVYTNVSGEAPLYEPMIDVSSS